MFGHGFSSLWVPKRKRDFRLKLLSLLPICPGLNRGSVGVLIHTSSYNCFPSDSAPPIAVEADALRMLSAVEGLDSVPKLSLAVRAKPKWQWVFRAVHPASRLKGVEHAALVGC